MPSSKEIIKTDFKLIGGTMKSPEWQAKLKEMVPYRAKNLRENPEKIHAARKLSPVLFE